MAEESMRDKDMVLAPNEFMYVLDKTKGHVDVFVGPTKQSLSGTDAPVVFDEAKKQFREAGHIEAKQLTRTAPEGWYVVLKNPSRDGKPPIGNGKQTAAHLDVGKKVNIPGPVSMCLWPGQMAKVLKGHHLRSNQYLLCRVYDEAAARENWKKAVIKRAAPTVTASSSESGLRTEETQVVETKAEETSLSSGELIMGQTLVIKGTDVSFYIPPSGIDVIPDENGELVREAVTLEALEYCLLREENGNSRYERGPAVVFPEPTEVFMERQETEGEEPVRKFKAIELNDNSGIYIKVIAEYEGPDYENPGQERHYAVGEELFITGKQEKIYFPREEHAIVKYDKSEIHFGIAIPEGEARYVLDRNEGTVNVTKGPKVFLPDPRREVIVRRILDYKTCNLLYPGNVEAFRHNAALAGVDLETYTSTDKASDVAAAMAGILESQMSVNYAAPAAAGTFAVSGMSLGNRAESRGLATRSARSFAGASLDRKTKYAEPRSITLSTKYEGAVSTKIHTGYALQLVRKNGQRRIVQGPQNVMLEYDETPEAMELSTGKPKNTDHLYSTAFLRVKANNVSDVVRVTTKDYIDVDVKLSYRMDFTGSSDKWFEVENYVKFLCDRLRSKLKSEARKHIVQDYYSNSTELIRAVVLGPDGAGMKFAENGMHVYEVEVLGVSIDNKDIEQAIVSSQKDAIRSSLALAADKRKLEVTIESEALKRETEKTLAQSRVFSVGIESEISKKKLELELLTIESEAKAIESRMAAALDREKAEGAVAEMSRIRLVENAKAQSEADSLAQAARIELGKAEAEALAVRMRSISSELIAALQAYSDRSLVEKMVPAFAPMSLLGGGSVQEILAKVLQGTSVAKNLLAAATTPNGSSSTAKA